MFVNMRMSKYPITVPSNTSIDDAANILKRHKFRRLPVVDEGKLVGFICDKDIAQVMPSVATTLSRYEINSLLNQIKVKDIMQRKVITVDVDATIEEAALIMCNNHISGMPVVSNGDKVVGIITETDIFKALIDVMGIRDGKTRLTLEVDDKVGVAQDISRIFAESGLNIDSFVTCKRVTGEYEIVIRSDIPNVAELTQKLTEQGYKVIHTVTFP